MLNKNKIIQDLFEKFEGIRYVAIYTDNELISKQKSQLMDSSDVDTDKYEELLVNPTLLTLARQRGNIDCGGLRFIIIGYGNFFQLITEVAGGHISICLKKNSDLSIVPEEIMSFLKLEYSEF